MFKLSISSLLFVFLSACSSGQKAGVVYHDSFDFSAVKSYSLYDHNSIFSESQSLLDNRRNAIEIAIERSMAKRKFSYNTIDKADVIVTYYVFNGKQNDYSKYNQVVHFCTHCLRASSWQTGQKYSAISYGNLIIDIVDPIQNRSVWRSVYPLDLKEKENSADTNERIIQAVSAMLAEFPQNNFDSKSVR
jgi:hypothetical protein